MVIVGSAPEALCCCLSVEIPTPVLREQRTPGLTSVQASACPAFKQGLELCVELVGW